jgi:uncharacterized repeat protein (TIGR01451 family)
MRAKQLLFAIALVLITAPSVARGTLAGTIITNQATVEIVAVDGTQSSINSNTVAINVNEIIDVAISRDSSSDVLVIAGEQNKPLQFTLTNKGNGEEVFVLDPNFNLTSDEYDPLSPIIVFDTDGNGQYDPQIDSVYVRGQNDPTLAPEASIKLLLLGSIPTNTLDTNKGYAELMATASTGHGVAGTLFSNAGMSGVDALIGSTTARAMAQGTYLVSTVDPQITKTQIVADPSGGNIPISGAIITYQLLAKVNGSGEIQNVAIVDAIPFGTTYLQGSLKLNATDITDISDNDAGSYANNEIRVNLGTVRAPALNTVTFQVKIN